MSQFENLKVSQRQKVTSQVLQTSGCLAVDTQLAACSLQPAAKQFSVVQIFKSPQHQ